MFTRLAAMIAVKVLDQSLISTQLRSRCVNATSTAAEWERDPKGSWPASPPAQNSRICFNKISLSFDSSLARRCACDQPDSAQSPPTPSQLIPLSCRLLSAGLGS
jgi:hypothetical protein